MKSKKEIKNGLQLISEKLKLLESSYNNSFKFLCSGNYLEYDKELNFRRTLLNELSSYLNLFTPSNIKDKEIKLLVENAILDYKNIISLKNNHLQRINFLKDETKKKLEKIRSAKLIIKNYINKNDGSPKIFDGKK